MVLNPEAQRKGQEEIDKVIGNDRLPNLEDRDSLPYVSCIIHETMRYVPVTITWRLLDKTGPFQMASSCTAYHTTQDQRGGCLPRNVHPQRCYRDSEHTVRADSTILTRTSLNVAALTNVGA